MYLGQWGANADTPSIRRLSSSRLASATDRKPFATIDGLANTGWRPSGSRTTGVPIRDSSSRAIASSVAWLLTMPQNTVETRGALLGGSAVSQAVETNLRLAALCRAAVPVRSALDRPRVAHAKYAPSGSRTILRVVAFPRPVRAGPKDAAAFLAAFRVHHALPDATLALVKVAFPPLATVGITGAVAFALQALADEAPEPPAAVPVASALPGIGEAAAEETGLGMRALTVLHALTSSRFATSPNTPSEIATIGVGRAVGPGVATDTSSTALVCSAILRVVAPALKPGGGR